MKNCRHSIVWGKRFIKLNATAAEIAEHLVSSVFSLHDFGNDCAYVFNCIHPTRATTNVGPSLCQWIKEVA